MLVGSRVDDGERQHRNIDKSILGIARKMLSCNFVDKWAGIREHDRNACWLKKKVEVLD